ncbi:MAG: hypothetical protein ACK5KN_17690 [Dysgonomonas sp.]|uniref:hypothetical protein n=1 Tax=Dysgonomonas sp. TaxID=1891233 RepID=UPI003A88806E
MTKTVIVKKTTLPDFLPHGWKKEVARVLEIHPNTVKNAIRAGKGGTFERIKKVAIEKWGDNESK